MQSWIPFIPDSASTMSGKVDALYFYLVGVTVFFTSLIIVVIGYFAIRYRRRSPSEIPRPIEGSLKLETLWSVIPFLIAMTMFVWGANIYFAQYSIPKDAMEISVVAKQWMWKLEHPGGQHEINELHVPVGQRVKLLMTSEDVIHSFFVPAFRIKQDVVPGRYTMLWFEATKPGTYPLFCAEYCGTNHSGMIGSIVVMEPAAFEQWLSGNADQVSPVAAGQALFTNKFGCASCHGDKGQGGRGPSLVGLLGSSVKLDNGTTLTADEGYVRDSILNPQSKIVAGYGPIMPTFAGQLTEEQLLEVISFVKSLSPPQAPSATVTPATVSASPAGSPKPGVSPSRETQKQAPVTAPSNSNKQAGNGRNVPPSP